MARPRLSDRLKGKSGRELMSEIEKEFENDKKNWFDSHFDGPDSHLFRSRREGFLFDEDVLNPKSDPEIKSYFEDRIKKRPQFVRDLHCPSWSGSMDKDWERAFTVPISVEQGETATVGNSNASSENRNHSQPDPSESSRQQKLRLADDIAEQLLKNNVQNLDNEAKRSSSAPLDPSFEGNTEPKRFTTKIEITPINPFESRPNVCSDENDGAPSIFHDDRTFSCARQAPVSTDQRPCSQYPGESTQPPIDDKFTHNASFLQNDDKSHTGECQSQHINRSQPQVRHIPIFVEGRPEPILPTNEVPSEKKILIPDQTPLKRTSDGNSASGVATTEMSSQSDQNHEACLEREIPVETQVSSATISQSASAPTTSLPMSVNPPSLASVSTLDSHQCVKQVQQEVDNLTRRVEKYTGTSRNDKEYLFLDEMLTRNLIKLDTIEVENNEQLRAARKNVIESIQKSIALLESKIPVPTNENTSIDDSSERIGELKPASAVLAQNCETILEVDSNENGKTKA